MLCVCRYPLTQTNPMGIEHLCVAQPQTILSEQRIFWGFRSEVTSRTMYLLCFINNFFTSVVSFNSYLSVHASIPIVLFSHCALEYILFSQASACRKASSSLHRLRTATAVATDTSFFTGITVLNRFAFLYYVSQTLLFSVNLASLLLL